MSGMKKRTIAKTATKSDSDMENNHSEAEEEDPTVDVITMDPSTKKMPKVIEEIKFVPADHTRSHPTVNGKKLDAIKIMLQDHGNCAIYLDEYRLKEMRSDGIFNNISNIFKFKSTKRDDASWNTLTNVLSEYKKYGELINHAITLLASPDISDTEVYTRIYTYFFDKDIDITKECFGLYSDAPIIKNAHLSGHLRPYPNDIYWNNLYKYMDYCHHLYKLACESIGHNYRVPEYPNLDVLHQKFRDMDKKNIKIKSVKDRQYKVPTKN